MTATRCFDYGTKKSHPYTPDGVISRVKFNQQNTVIFAVEGPDDVIALGGIVDEKKCNVVFVNGKKNVIECLKKVHQEKIENIVGLVDSDYGKIFRYSKNQPQLYLRRYLFYTDFHDMNAVVVSSGAYLKMLQDIYQPSGPQVEKLNEIRKDSLEISAQIGLIRCLNEDEAYTYGFNFKKDFRNDPKNIRQYIDFDEKKANIESLIQSLKKELSPKEQRKLCQYIIEVYPEEVKELYPKDDLPWQLCQGHDLFAILYALLKDQGYDKISFDKFSYMLFEQFQYEDLLESGKRLHEDIRIWERKAKKSGKPFVILRDQSPKSS